MLRKSSVSVWKAIECVFTFFLEWSLNACTHQRWIDILGSPFGGVFDLQDWNVEDANRIVHSAEEIVQKCEQRLQRTETALHQMEEEIRSLIVLKDSVHDEEKRLQETRKLCADRLALASRLIYASLDVSINLGLLAGNSETPLIHHTPVDFARSVLNFATVMGSEEKLNAFLVRRDPLALGKTLALIAYRFDGDGNPRVTVLE